MIYVTDVLFSPRYKILFLYVLMYYGLLHKHGADVTMFDNSCDSEPPHFQVGQFKLSVFS